MVRPETKPDDVHGMLAAQGILTSRGGRTSHAALVARQFGKPAVVGVAALDIDLPNAPTIVRIGGERVLREGDVDLDRRHAPARSSRASCRRSVPDLADPYLASSSSWADEFRRLEVWANADYPDDAERARELRRRRASASAAPSTCSSSPTASPRAE